MERYIGLDVHAASCTLAVVGPSGKRLKSLVVETSGAALIDALRSVPGQRHVCMEEGTQSQSLHEILSPHVAERVVAGMEEKSYGPKSDRRDAFALAEALRVGAIETRVHKGTSCCANPPFTISPLTVRGNARQVAQRVVSRYDRFDEGDPSARRERSDHRERSSRPSRR